MRELKTPTPKDRVGTVYLIRSLASGLHKIGITGNWDRRSKELKVGELTELVKHVTTFNPKAVETALHHHFRAHRLPQSEWFALDANQLQQVLGAMAAVQKEFDEKQEDPAIRLLTLEAALAKAKTRQQREIYLSIIQRHLREHFPEQVARQEAAAQAAELAEQQQRERRARAEWLATPLRKHVLAEWAGILVASLFLTMPYFVVLQMGHDASRNLYGLQSRRMPNQQIANALTAYGIGVAGTMAWSVSRLRNQRRRRLAEAEAEK